MKLQDLIHGPVNDPGLVGAMMCHILNAVAVDLEGLKAGIYSTEAEKDAVFKRIKRNLRSVELQFRLAGLVS